eukprot:2745855-Amphidinium_carterae.1
MYERSPGPGIGESQHASQYAGVHQVEGASVAGTLTGAAGGGTGGSANKMVLGCSSGCSRSGSPTSLQKWYTFWFPESRRRLSCRNRHQLVSSGFSSTWCAVQEAPLAALSVLGHGCGLWAFCAQFAQGLDSFDHSFAATYRFMRLALHRALTTARNSARHTDCFKPGKGSQTCSCVSV